jgi:hypothetical protein
MSEARFHRPRHRTVAAALASLNGPFLVPCLDRVSCFAEKFLANTDRGNDEAMLGRDVIDLAFMVEGWGTTPARQGAALARQAYGDVVDRAARAAAKKLLERKDYLKRCISGLTIADLSVLASGLAQLAATDWTETAARRRPGK